MKVALFDHEGRPINNNKIAPIVPESGIETNTSTMQDFARFAFEEAQKVSTITKDSTCRT